MKIGVTLPTFTDSAEPALIAARTAEAGGLDGVFVYDHLWPMGRPGRPALWSFAVLAAVAASTRRVAVGPFVARVGLLDDGDLVDAFRALAAIAGPARVIAALGAGDRLSSEENMAYGVPYPPAAERLAAVGAVVDRVKALGLDAWVGGNSKGAAAVADAHGAARNLWQVAPEDIETGLDRNGHVPRITWGGAVPPAEMLDALAARGVEWCVLNPLQYIARPAEAVETVCEAARAVRYPR